MIKIIKYFFESLAIYLFFFIIKLLGLSISRILFSFIFKKIGPLIRSRDTLKKNLNIFSNKISEQKKKEIELNMWSNYGKTFVEYMFLKKFRKENLHIKIEGKEILDEVNHSNKPVIFISGHFNNFELMAMQIEKAGVELAAVYRPLNNKFLNPIMENIRRKYICKNQIKKGISGTRQILQQFKNKTSIAMMIDQRVSEGIKSNFFNQEAFTTTIPAQFVKKFNAKIVPVYIERVKENDFKLKIYNPIKFKAEDTLETITLHLNSILEKMILKNPDQWIWSHNRWK